VSGFLFIKIQEFCKEYGYGIFKFLNAPFAALAQKIIDEQNEAKLKNEQNANEANDPLVSNYIPAPRYLPGIPDANHAQPKTPVQGGGNLRKRWKD
jgi:hypothetical protein